MVLAILRFIWARTISLKPVTNVSVTEFAKSTNCPRKEAVMKPSEAMRKGWEGKERIPLYSFVTKGGKKGGNFLPETLEGVVGYCAVAALVLGSGEADLLGSPNIWTMAARIFPNLLRTDNFEGKFWYICNGNWITQIGLLFDHGYMTGDEIISKLEYWEERGEI